MILIENPLAGKAGHKKDLSIAPIANFYLLANVFFGSQFI
jgi:hypothetical protein